MQKKLKVGTYGPFVKTKGVYETAITLGLSSIASNDEIQSAYKKMAKTWHPDMAGSEEAKKVFEKKFAEINEAMEKIKKERGL